jgi:hypothetical protein
LLTPHSLSAEITPHAAGRGVQYLKTKRNKKKQQEQAMDDTFLIHRE